MPGIDCGLQLGDGGRPPVAGEVHQRPVVMDRAANAASRGRGQRPVQIGNCLRIMPRVVVQNAPVECGSRQALIAGKRSRVVEQGLVIATECLVGKGPVEIALGRVLCQRNADAESRDGVFEPAELARAESLVEVGPEVARLKIDGVLELPGGEGVLPLTEIGAAEVAMLPGCTRLRQ